MKISILKLKINKLKLKLLCNKPYTIKYILEELDYLSYHICEISNKDLYYKSKTIKNIVTNNYENEYDFINIERKTLAKELDSILIML